MKSAFGGKKLLAIFIGVMALFLLTTKSVWATTSIRCYGNSFWRNEPNNTPGHYYLNTKISTAKPGQLVVVAASWNNNGTTTLTNPLELMNLTGFSWRFIDADHECVFGSLLSCSYGTTALPGSGGSAAERIWIPASAVIGNILVSNAAAFGNNLNVSGVCTTANLTVVAP